MSEIEGDDNKEDLKYEFRKQYQKMERKNPSERLVLEQKKVVENMSQEQKIHINPNKKTVFVKLKQLERGYLRYLKEKHNIPLDYRFLISIDKPANQEISSIPFEKVVINSQPELKLTSFNPHFNFIDEEFEPSSSFLLQTLDPFLQKNFD